MRDPSYVQLYVFIELKGRVLFSAATQEWHCGAKGEGAHFQLCAPTTALCRCQAVTVRVKLLLDNICTKRSLLVRQLSSQATKVTSFSSCQ